MNALTAGGPARSSARCRSAWGAASALSSATSRSPRCTRTPCTPRRPPREARARRADDALKFRRAPPAAEQKRAGPCDTPRMGILPTIILMLGVIGMMSFLAQKVAIPAPVLLAVAGVVWSLIPSLPALEIAPAVILSVFLPPLLYADAW